MVRIPEFFSGKVKYILNDKSMNMVARNAIFMLVLVLIPNLTAGVECAIHMWYSACIRGSHFNLINKYVRPAVEEATTEAKASKDKQKAFTKRFEHDGRVIEISLTATEWKRLLDFFPKDVSDPEFLKAIAKRNEVTLDPAYDDERDRFLMRNERHRRLSLQQYWEHGIVYPFGQDLNTFEILNS